MSELDQFIAQFNAQRVPGSTMDKATWTALSKDTQTTWDTISSEDKAKILAAAEQRATKKLSVNVQETELHTPEEPEATRQANVSDIAHPGDTRHVMGSVPKGSSTKPASVAKATVAASTRTASVAQWQAHPHSHKSSDGLGDILFTPSSTSDSVDELGHWGTHERPADDMTAWGVTRVDGDLFYDPDVPTKPSTQDKSESIVHQDPFSLQQLWDEDESPHFW